MSGKSDAKKNWSKKEALMHLDSLLRTALYITGDETSAKNLIEETYLSAYRFGGILFGTAECRTWLFKTMTGLLQEHKHFRDSAPEFAKINNHGPINAETEADRPILLFQESHPDDLCDKVDDEMIKDAIWQLPVDLRYAVVLSFLEGFSHQEIAGIVDIGFETVKSQLMRGRRLLQEILWNRMVRDGHVKNRQAYN
jgi:RNA polymerase sigma-70 factor (ECF subfamily)